MKSALIWQVPDRVAATVRPRELRRQTAVFVRGGVIGGAAARALLLLVQTQMPDLMPPLGWDVTWWLVLGYAGAFALLGVLPWLMFRLSPRRSFKQGLTRRGPIQDSERPWKNFKAFAIQPVPDVPDADELVLYGSTGRQHRLFLPDEEAIRSRVVRLVARYVPMLDECDDPQSVVQPITDIPGWLKLVMAVSSAAYAVFVGRWLSEMSVSRDLIKLLLYATAFVGPATWIAWYWSRRHKRTQVWGWAIGFTMLNWLLILVVALCYRP